MYATNFFRLSGNEVTSINYQFWISVHDYVVVDWKYISIFMTLERAVEGGTAYNLTTIIMNIVCSYGGLLDQKMRENLITFGANEVSTF